MIAYFGGVGPTLLLALSIILVGAELYCLGRLGWAILHLRGRK
jgi:hypothetical protein